MQVTALMTVAGGQPGPVGETLLVATALDRIAVLIEDESRRDPARTVRPGLGTRLGERVEDPGVNRLSEVCNVSPVPGQRLAARLFFGSLGFWCACSVGARNTAEIGLIGGR